MASLNWQIDGLDSLKSKLEQAANELPRNAAANLYQFAEGIMTVSKDERVPVRTGRLMNSGYVETPVQEGNTISVTMGYGTDYALYVHEDTFGRHNSPGEHWTRPGSGPKYLENPMKEAEGRFATEVGAQSLSDSLAA